MFNHYVELAKHFMKQGKWKEAMFHLGKAEVYAGANNTASFTLEEHLEIIDNLVQQCHSETGADVMKPLDGLEDY